MNRRSLSSIVACVLLVGLFVVAAMMPVPYVTMSPGPTVDVLAERKGEEIVQIDGQRTYETDGRLELTTVSVTSPGQPLTLVEAMAAWFDQTRAVYPRDAIYPPDQSVEEVERENSVQMVSSQDTAVAAALTELGYELEGVVEVLGVTQGAPADGKLQVRDKILRVNGVKITDAESVAKAVQRTGVGGTATFRIRRDGKLRTVELKTQAAEDDPGRAIVGVVIGQGFDFPFDVSVNISDRIGGPSAGLIFSLAVYDKLTPGSLVEEVDVAGTGTITAKGVVGPIGGIQQKIVAAADNGADLFLVPPGNCEAALEAEIDEEEITLVRARTLHSAVESITAYTEGATDDLPSCG